MKPRHPKYDAPILEPSFPNMTVTFQGLALLLNADLSRLLKLTAAERYRAKNRDVANFWNQVLSVLEDQYIARHMDAAVLHKPNPTDEDGERFRCNAERSLRRLIGAPLSAEARFKPPVHPERAA